jgi:ribosomal protein L37E
VQEDKKLKDKKQKVLVECKACGKKFSDTEALCPYCGKSPARKENKQMRSFTLDTSATNKQSLRAVGIGVLVAILLIGTYLLCGGGGSKPPGKGTIIPQITQNVKSLSIDQIMGYSIGVFYPDKKRIVIGAKNKYATRISWW